MHIGVDGIIRQLAKFPQEISERFETQNLCRKLTWETQSSRQVYVLRMSYFEHFSAICAMAGVTLAICVEYDLYEDYNEL